MARVLRETAAVFFLSMLIVWGALCADVLHLKDETEVQGTIIETTELAVNVVTASGSRACPISSVSYIEREGSATTGQAPTGVMHQQQQKSDGELGFSLSYEQEWNNAVYYAKQRERLECTRNWAAALSLWGCGVIGVVLSAYFLLTEAGQNVPSELRPLVDAALSVSMALFPLGYLALTSRGPNTIWCEKACAETARLEAIGQRRGWAYLEKLIEPPTLTDEVIVKEEDSVLDWIIFFGSLED